MEESGSVSRDSRGCFSLPDGVDARHLWERERQQLPLLLIQEGDSGPVDGHDKVALWQLRT